MIESHFVIGTFSCFSACKCCCSFPTCSLLAFCPWVVNGREAWPCQSRAEPPASFPFQSLDENSLPHSTSGPCGLPSSPQERNAASKEAESEDGPPTDSVFNPRDDRPIGGKRSTYDLGEDGAENGGDLGGHGAREGVGSVGGTTDDDADGGSGQARGVDAPAVAAAAGLKPWQRRKRAGPSSRTTAAAKLGGGSGDGAEQAGVEPPTKPWQRKKKAAGDGDSTAASAAVPKTVADGTAAAAAADAMGPEGGSEVKGGAPAGEMSATAPVKPWLKKKRPGGGGVAASSGFGDDSNEGDAVVVMAKPRQAAAAANTASGAAVVVVEGASTEGEAAVASGERDETAGGEGGVATLEACLQDRDWKKRVAAFEVQPCPLLLVPLFFVSVAPEAGAFLTKGLLFRLAHTPVSHRLCLALYSGVYFFWPAMLVIFLVS